jgi:hypothetical protein
MGSIIGCYDLDRWYVVERGTYQAGKYTGQIGIKVEVGYANYDYEGDSTWSIIIPEYWYDELVKGNYKLISKKLRERTILDDNGNELFTYGAYLDNYIAQ